MELAARQPRPPDGVFAFLDVLIGGAPVIVEGHNTFGRAAQIDEDEADAGIQLAGMPFDLRHHTRFRSHDPAW